MSPCKLSKLVEFGIDDLLLLEEFQIGYLPGYAPERELAAVLWARPYIESFLTRKCPAVAGFVGQIKSRFGPAGSEAEVSRCACTLLAGIDDLLVYNKYPEVYDGLAFHGWDFGEITGIVDLRDKVVIDGGAGTGRVAMEAARTAQCVFAVEPVTRLRAFMREKACRAELRTLFVVDGFLDAIPLPDGFADVLITSHALGWRLDGELREFERVVKLGGWIVHCPGTALGRDDATHHTLIEPPWSYRWSIYDEADGPKRKYWKLRGADALKE